MLTRYVNSDAGNEDDTRHGNERAAVIVALCECRGGVDGWGCVVVEEEERREGASEEENKSAACAAD